MKIRIVGTGSISSVNNSPSYIIDDKIVIDMPNGNYKNIKKLGIEPESITNILITHFHGDHYFDMPFYLFEILDHKEHNYFIYCDKLGTKKIKKLTKLAFPFSYYKTLIASNIKYCHDISFKIDDYLITKIPVIHGHIKPAYGYIIMKNDKRIGFTGDAKLCKQVEYMASICDYLICECTFKEGNSEHMGIDNIEYLVNKYPKCKIIVTHMTDNTKKELKEKKDKRFIIPNDGDVINIK